MHHADMSAKLYSVGHVLEAHLEGHTDIQIGTQLNQPVCKYLQRIPVAVEQYMAHNSDLPLKEQLASSPVNPSAVATCRAYQHLQL